MPAIPAAYYLLRGRVCDWRRSPVSGLMLYGRWRSHVYTSSVLDLDHGSQRCQETTVVFANRDYAILKGKFFYLGIGTRGSGL
jgi:hypothetical protein